LGFLKKAGVLNPDVNCSVAYL